MNEHPTEIALAVEERAVEDIYWRLSAYRNAVKTLKARLGQPAVSESMKYAREEAIRAYYEAKEAWITPAELLALACVESQLAEIRDKDKRPSIRRVSSALRRLSGEEAL